MIQLVEEGTKFRNQGSQKAADPLTFEVVRPTALSAEHHETWKRLLRHGALQNSPFLHPQFTREVAAVRDDVEVAVLKQGGEAVGFFPFQRSAWNIGKPVGGRLSSYQGLVVRKDIQWSAEQVTRGCNLAAWQFDQLDLSQPQFVPHARLVEGAAFLDLSQGYEAYRESRKCAGSQRIAKVESLSRKLEREAGPIRFKFHSTDTRLVETLAAWKSLQFQETGLADVFAHSWVPALLNNILDRPSKSFSAVVSALYYALDRPIAISYALRAGNVLHGMFIAYDREFAKYSPGLILLLSIAREASECGINRFQLGSGGDHYKQSLASGETRVGVGSVECRPLAKVVRRGWELARRAAHSSALSPLFSTPLKLIRPVRERLSFR